MPDRPVPREQLLSAPKPLYYGVCRECDARVQVMPSTTREPESVRYLIRTHTSPGVEATLCDGTWKEAKEGSLE